MFLIFLSAEYVLFQDVFTDNTQIMSRTVFALYPYFTYIFHLLISVDKK